MFYIFVQYYYYNAPMIFTRVTTQVLYFRTLLLRNTVKPGV
jgi:hypothetical protein